MRPYARKKIDCAVRNMEMLESRMLLTASVLSYHNGVASTGVNSNETVLTPSNVNVNQFGKNFTTSVDGQVYAQPLYDPAVNITTGTNAGTHNVVFVATEHDSLYAIDADGGTVLWQDSFTNPNLPGVNLLPGVTAVTTVPATDTNSTDLTPEIGITSTPVIDPSTNMLYVTATTKQITPTGKNYVYMLYKVNIQSGAIVASSMIGDTIPQAGGNYSNTSNVYSLGDGDGSTVVNGQSRVYFNAMREFNRPGLTLSQGSIYIAFASHGDNGPYHGWMLGYSASTLALDGVLDTSPNGDENGIWQGGDAIDVDPQGFFYFETGNGAFNPSSSNFNAQGFPIDGDYGDSFVKVAIDTTTSATNQNINGWGLKVVDFFAPFNDVALSEADRDLGSGGPVILPDSAGNAQHPHLLLGSGKEGKIYLIDRDNMGKFNSTTDHVVQEQGSAINGALDTPAYFNGQIYYVGGYTDNAKTFSVSNAAFSAAPTSISADSFAFPGSTPSISANGSTNGVVWDIDHGTNQLRAYDASGYGDELWTSNMDPSRDALGSAVKFTVPTVANGRVYVGTSNQLVVYGPPAPTTTAPAAPTGLTATAISGVQINLAWTDNSNNESGFNIQMSTDGGKAFSALTSVGVNVTSYAVQNLSVSTVYTFRVYAFNSVHNSAYTNSASATTAALPPAIDFSSGFANAPATMKLNGTATVNGTSLQLTNTGTYEAASAFTTNSVSDGSFSSQFTFQLTNVTADGFTFVLQNSSPSALGADAGGLGYQGIGKSVAIKFDLWNNSGESPDSTGLYTNGAIPTTPATDLTSTGINLHSGDILQDAVSYNGTTLTNTITDTKTNATATQSYTVNIPALLGASTAYVGFTGGTGGAGANQNILTWSYTPTATTAPAAASNLQLAATSGTQIDLTWQDNSDNEAGFKILRSNDGKTFTQVFETGANVTTYMDGSLTPNTLYYYEVVATNGIGDAKVSNIQSLTTPIPPNTPTKVVATLDTPTEVDLTWTNNATNDSGYKVLRKASTGSEFATVGNLPADSTSFKDMTVSPGTNYDYHIQCYNVAGYSDFGGINLTTPLAPPSVTASAGDKTVTLKWAPVTGAATYNIYRSLTSGGEGTTAYVTGDANATFADTGLTDGKKYYYRVSAVNSLVQSLPSVEVSATPATATSPTSLATPANLTATPGTGIITLSWNATAGATSYDIFRGTTSSGESLSGYATGVTTTTYADTGVKAGTTYYYFITALGPGIESHRTGEVSATPKSVQTAALFSTVGPLITNPSPIDADANLLKGKLIVLD